MITRMQEMQKKMCGMWDYPSTKRVGGVSAKLISKIRKFDTNMMLEVGGRGWVKIAVGGGMQHTNKQGDWRLYPYAPP